MKTVFLAMAASTVVVATTITFLSANPKEPELDKLLLTPHVEALAEGEGLWDDVVDWWNSKVYKCTVKPCSRSVGIEFIVSAEHTTYGEILKCEDGSDYAHCWECEHDCDAPNPLMDLLF